MRILPLSLSQARFLSGVVCVRVFLFLSLFASTPGQSSFVHCVLGVRVCV